VQTDHMAPSLRRVSPQPEWVRADPRDVTAPPERVHLASIRIDPQTRAVAPRRVRLHSMRRRLRGPLREVTVRTRQVAGQTPQVPAIPVG
jgi:hypothetical protein